MAETYQINTVNTNETDDGGVTLFRMVTGKVGEEEVGEERGEEMGEEMGRGVFREVCEVGGEEEEEENGGEEGTGEVDIWIV